MARTKTVRLVMSGSTATPCTLAPRRGAVGADERAGDDLVGSVDAELARLGVEQQVDEVEQVARVERAGIGGHLGGQAGGGDDLHAVLHHYLVGDAERAVAALLHREVDDDRARLHRRNRLLGDEPRRWTAGDEGGGDDDVGGPGALLDE